MPLSVFISSTSELETYPPGRASYRDKVRDAVIKAGLHPVMSEYWASSGAALPLEECLERVKGSNVVVVIVAHKYGSVPPDQPKPERKSITWLECEQAVKDGNEVLAFLIDDKYPWPMDMVATSRKRDLGRFKEWLLGRGIRSKFTTPEDLEAKVLHALTEWRKRRRTRPRERDDRATEAMSFRTAYRKQLTDIMCLFYQHVQNDPRLIVAPDGMPVLVEHGMLPENPVPLSAIDAKLDLDRSLPPSPGQEGPSTMVSRLLRHNKKLDLFNGLIFRFNGTENGRPKFKLGYYFDYLNTSEALGFELANHIVGIPALRKAVEREGMDAGAITSAFNRCTLPLRTSTLPTGYSSRCTAFGTCALVVLKVSNQPPQMILNVRSATLAETAGLDHVIPAGTFQPMQDDRFLDREFSLTENLVREFAEELFNDAGISGHEAKRLVLASLDDLYGPVGKEFRAKIIHQNRYKLLYLGTVIDPVNLKPEALTVFLLHQGYLMSVSGLDLEPSPETDESGIQPHEFSEERLDSLISSSNMVPTGKAHLMLVKKHFSYLMSELASI